MTEAQLYVFKLDVPCPHCGQMDQQIISELISNQFVPCSCCGKLIDVSSNEWRTRIAIAAHDIRKIYIPKT